MLFNIFSNTGNLEPDIIGFVRTIESEDTPEAIHLSLCKVINEYLITQGEPLSINTLCLFGDRLFTDFVYDESMNAIFESAVEAFNYVRLRDDEYSYPVVFAASKVTTE